jgi:tRNA threonylcarbamoyladenosine biosynthesis protein TsaB
MLIQSPDGFAHLLFGEIEALLKRAGIEYRDIAAFASASGPGSFTGVRIGLTAVKGLAEATGRPAIAVSNLQALASFGRTHLRAVVIDARRGEIYGAVYNAELGLVLDEVVIKAETWLADVKQVREWRPNDSLEFITNGYELPEAERPVIKVEAGLAAAIGKIAWDRLRQGSWQDPAEIDANYVRRSDAELLWKDPK